MSLIAVFAAWMFAAWVLARIKQTRSEDDEFFDAESFAEFSDEKDLRENLACQMDRVKNLMRLLRFCNFQLEHSDDPFSNAKFINRMLKSLDMTQIDFIVLSEKVERSMDSEMMTDSIMGAIECLRCVSLAREFGVPCPAISDISGLDDSLKSMSKFHGESSGPDFGPLRKEWY